jgi:hypothetical protein
MLYREIIILCSEIHRKHINEISGHNAKLCNVRPGCANLQGVDELITRYNILLLSHWSHVVRIFVSSTQISIFLKLNNKLLLNFTFHLSEQRLREMSVVTVSWVFVLAGMFLCENRMLASSCPSVRPYGTIRLPLDGFSWNFIFEDSSKISRENSSFIKIRP